MTWNPTNTPEQFFDRESRAAIEESCKRALTLIRGGAGFDSPELALLLDAIWALANALAQRKLQGQSVNWQLDAVDVADAFTDRLMRAGMPCYDMSRPFLPYATTTISRLCVARRPGDQIRRCAPLPEGIADRRAVLPRLEREEIRVRVRQAVRLLPRTLRRAIIARYWLGLCPKLAAARLGANVNTFNGWTFRARKILGRLLDGEDFCGSASIDRCENG